MCSVFVVLARIIGHIVWDTQYLCINAWLDAVTNYFLPVIEAVPRFLENLTDEELKKESKETKHKSIFLFMCRCCLACKHRSKITTWLKLKVADSLNVKYIVTRTYQSSRFALNNSILVVSYLSSFCLFSHLNLFNSVSWILTDPLSYLRNQSYCNTSSFFSRGSATILVLTSEAL